MAERNPTCVRRPGGTPIIRFQIYEVDCEACSAIGEILSRPAGVASVTGEYTIEPFTPGVCIIDDEGKCKLFVDIYDKAGCYLNEPHHHLKGRIGYASYLTGAPRSEYQPETG